MAPTYNNSLFTAWCRSKLPTKRTYRGFFSGDMHDYRAAVQDILDVQIGCAAFCLETDNI